jgi:putative glutamine amidotransferase
MGVEEIEHGDFGVRSARPTLAWVPLDHRLLGEDGHQMPYLVLGDKYVCALRDAANVQPVAFPLAEAGQIAALLPMVHGVMLTGSPSNVHPSHFDEVVSDANLPLDPQRDALTLALVRACLAAGVPLLGVCRGFQEINVAMGGSLHQQVHAVAGLADHREPEGASQEVQYGPAHALHVAAGSELARWAGGTEVQVNSLHGQGIRELARGLHAVGLAPDGLIEAFVLEGASTFAYAVQWHPEWRCTENPFSRAIFEAFGAACRARRNRIQGVGDV